MWEALVEGAAPEALLTGSTSFTGDDLREFLQLLLDHQLLVPGAEPPVNPAPAASLEKLGQAEEKPRVTVFDDLADLFLADPIHDVARNAGWPVLDGN